MPPTPTRPILAAFALLLLAAGAALACDAHAAKREPLVGGPCDGCDAVFDGLPAAAGPQARIAPAGEPGTPFVIKGVVTDAARRPVPGVIVYAYHTDARGHYPGRGDKQPHGTLRGFARSDAEGRYAFETIRPASYPVADAPPQHVHMIVVEPGRCHYYIDDVVFTDDPRLSPALRQRMDRGRGGSGVTTPLKSGGAWGVRRDIVLGAGVADYARCGAT